MHNAWLYDLVVKVCAKEAPYNVANQPQQVIPKSLPVSIPDPHDGPRKSDAGVEGSSGSWGIFPPDVDLQSNVNVSWEFFGGVDGIGAHNLQYYNDEHKNAHALAHHDAKIASYRVLHRHKGAPVSAIEDKSTDHADQSPSHLCLPVDAQQNPLISFGIPETKSQCNHGIQIGVAGVVANGKSHHAGGHELQIEPELLFEAGWPIHHHEDPNWLKQVDLVHYFLGYRGGLHEGRPQVEGWHDGEVAPRRVHVV